MRDYCNATHGHSPNGCYEWADHTGQHRGYKNGSDDAFYWGEEPPTGEVNVSLTQEQLFVIVGALGNEREEKMDALKLKLYEALVKLK